ncbi:MAG: MBL fold metallo-hydrolase [Anaerovoracaceae bacterium]|jgi:7,8-dihydropterin-6-yl-methyl-4-(beta-D-ribofuranosyl)aminobenzene 5'-phosphate synthase|nr:MBL fold metallo-hydrolase [Anaerovoracaceae bacterium]
MIIKILIENTSPSPRLESEHGLSIYVETINHKVLFDTGASNGFLNNAQKMGVTIPHIDVALISHGHYDHGGGLLGFLNANSTAPVYIRENAFNEYYSFSNEVGERYIGLDKNILNYPQIILTQGHTLIDDELELFSNVEGTKFVPSGNKQLFVKNNDKLKGDIFEHEQNLIIHEGDKSVLMAGCAHRGIPNIMDHFYRLNKSYPTHVVGGFHLYNRSKDKDESPEEVYALGEYLKSKATIYYTCHCTGTRNFSLLKELLGEQINYLSTGSQLTL